MALTKIKLNTMVTGTLPDANIPDDITIDSAAAAPANALTGDTLASGVTASSLTSVGTLTGLASSGTIVLGDLDIIPTSSNVSVIKHDSGSGSLTLQGDQVNIKNRAGNETGLSYNDGGGVILSHNSKVTSSSADTTFKIETTSGTTIFPVLDFVSSHSSVGAKIRQDGSDVITIDNDQDVTFADDVTISGNTFMNGSYLGINNVGYIRSASNELRLQTGTGGLNVMNNAYNTSLFSITNAGTATFAGNITTTSSSITVDPPSGDAVLALQHSSQTLRIDQNSIRTTTSSPLTIFTANTAGNGMYIATDGNIAFGTTTARSVSGYRLLTVNHATNGGGINFQKNGTNYGAIYNVSSDMYYDADTHHIFRTGGSMGGTTRFRINSTGFVGIGASPNALLDINKSTDSDSAPTTSESFEGYRLILANPELANNATNAIGFSMYGGNVCASIDAYTFYNGNYETSLRFQTRKDGAGGLKSKLIIGPDGEFHHYSDRSGLMGTFENDGSNPYGIKIDFDSATPNNNTNYFIACQDSTNDKFKVYSDGDVQSRTNSYTGISDERLKENIVDATPKLDELNQVRIVNYNFKDEPDKKQLGVVAQELQEIFPKMVSEYGEDDYLGVKYSIFVPMLIKAVQELSAKVKELENA